MNILFSAAYTKLPSEPPPYQEGGRFKTLQQRMTLPLAWIERGLRRKNAVRRKEKRYRPIADPYKTP